MTDPFSYDGSAQIPITSKGNATPFHDHTVIQTPSSTSSNVLCSYVLAKSCVGFVAMATCVFGNLVDVGSFWPKFYEIFDVYDPHGYNVIKSFKISNRSGILKPIAVHNTHIPWIECWGGGARNKISSRLTSKDGPWTWLYSLGIRSVVAHLEEELLACNHNNSIKI